MSVVILGGNECMERRYMDLCKAYSCDAKVFTKPGGGLKNKLGRPDLTIFFTSTMSHKMVQGALSELEGTQYDNRALPHQLSLRTAGNTGKAHRIK